MSIVKCDKCGEMYHLYSGPCSKCKQGLLTKEEYSMYRKCRSFFAGIALGMKEKNGDVADKIMNGILKTETWEI